MEILQFVPIWLSVIAYGLLSWRLFHALAREAPEFSRRFNKQKGFLVGEVAALRFAFSFNSVEGISRRTEWLMFCWRWATRLIIVGFVIAYTYVILTMTTLKS